jgi:RNA binding exosome subunit
MVKLVHNIEISVFEKEEQILNSIYKTFNKILPIDFNKEKIEIKKTKAEGFNQEIIHIISLKIRKYNHSLLLLQNIFKKLDKKDIEKIYEQRDSRLDRNGNFFIRLDKKSLLNNIHQLTESGDCFHFKIKIAAFPSNRENSIKSLEELLEKLEHE